MSGKLCPNCHQSFLIRSGNRRRSKLQKRCKNCGYWEMDSRNKVKEIIHKTPDFSEAIMKTTFRKGFEKIQEKKVEKEIIPSISLDSLTREEKEEVINNRSELIKEINHEKGIQKILKEIRKNKYSSLNNKVLYFQNRKGQLKGYVV